MSEVAIWQPGSDLVPVSASPRGELDDWIMVADQVVRLAEVICRSPFVPDGLRGSAPATAAAILTGRELGIPPMTSLANIHVIHGKPGLSAMVMRALIQGQGHEWIDVEVTNTRVVVKGRRKGTADWTTASFSTADAQTAKLQLGGYPQDKLYARASARLARRAFADVIAGMPYAAEELEDGLTEEDGPAASATPGGTPAEKSRTAQRASRRPAAAAPADGPAQAPRNAPAPAPAPAQTAPAGDLPPLPGEDEPPPNETDYDTPGTINPQQRTRIWATLTSDIGYPNSDKDTARATCAAIIGRDITSSNDLSHREAGTVIDTLSAVLDIARRRGGDPRAIIEGLTRDPRAAALTELSRLGITGTEAIADTAGSVLRIVPPASLESLTTRQAVALGGMLARCPDKDALDVLLKTGEVPGDGQ